MMNGLIYSLECGFVDDSLIMGNMETATGTTAPDLMDLSSSR